MTGKSKNSKSTKKTKKTKKSKALTSMEKMFGNAYNGADPFTPTKSYKLKYAGVHTLSVGASGTLGSIQEYNLNSIYDPDATGAGHQPYGFDVLALAYSRYKVNAVDVKLKFTDTTIDALNITWMITNPSNSAETLAGISPYTAQERQQCGSVNLNNSGSQKITKHFYCPVWRASNVTKLQFDSDVDNYTAPVTGNPGNLLQFQVACADLRGGSSGSVIYEIEILYYVTFYQRKIVAQS